MYNIIILIIIILCIVCTYTDIKWGKVKNKYLITIGGFAIVLNMLCHCLYRDIDSADYIWSILICLGISLLLYMFKIWAGGDCKYLAVIALALPAEVVYCSFYNISYVMLIPILAFIIAYIYLIIESFVFWTKEKQKKKLDIRNITVSFIEYLKYYLVIVFFDYFAFKVIGAFYSGRYFSWIMILINLIFVLIIQRLKILQYKSVIIALVIADLLLAFFGAAVILNRQIIIIWLAVIISNTMKTFVEVFNYEEIDIARLHEGMILSTPSSIIISQGLGEKHSILSDETLGSRLVKEDIEHIQRWSLKKKKITRVTIVRKIPFASFISIATFIVIIAAIYRLKAY